MSYIIFLQQISRMRKEYDPRRPYLSEVQKEKNVACISIKLHM